MWSGSDNNRFRTLQKMSVTYVLYIRKQVYNKTLKCLENAYTAFKVIQFRKKTICESAAHPSGYRGTQLWFGFVVSTQQQKKQCFVVFNQCKNPHT